MSEGFGILRLRFTFYPNALGTMVVRGDFLMTQWMSSLRAIRSIGVGASEGSGLSTEVRCFGFVSRLIMGFCVSRFEQCRRSGFGIKTLNAPNPKPQALTPTRRFMGSYQWGHKSPNMGYISSLITIYILIRTRRLASRCEPQLNPRP